MKARKEYSEMNNNDMASFTDYKSFNTIYKIKSRVKIVKSIKYILLGVIIILFLPWTQNIRFKGRVTSLNQEDRPQQLNNIIPGKIVKWYVKEGDEVMPGDTILQIGEVKEEYFDQALLERTLQQISAKQKALGGYVGKVGAATNQMMALSESKDLKLKQLNNKIQQQYLYISIDSTNLIGGQAELNIYERQVEGAEKMFDNGAISLIELEKRKANFQNSIAKVQSLKNKLNQSRQELQVLRLERENIIQEYNDKMAKVEGERFGSISSAASAEFDIAKLRNIYSNYNERAKLYYILSPARGQIGNIKKAGIGMLIKEGDFIADINPTIQKKALEVFINPVDLPLINVGQKLQLQFDGFPAIIFSGWPKANYGTFTGKIYSIEKAANKNGQFRALVVEDETERKWPDALSIGGGANGIALLKDVTIIYEIWRNINGFPPEFYQPKIENKK